MKRIAIAALLAAAATPAAAQRTTGITVVRSHATAANAATSHAPAPPPRFSTQRRRIQPFTAAQVQEITGGKTALEPVTLTAEHHETPLAEVAFASPSWVYADPGSPVSFYPPKTGDDSFHGAVVTIHAQAGKSYLIDFDVIGSALHVEAPGASSDVTVHGGGGHVPVVLTADETRVYAVAINAPQSAWGFVSCTVSVLQ